MISFATIGAGGAKQSTTKISFDHIVIDKRQGRCERIIGKSDCAYFQWYAFNLWAKYTHIEIAGRFVKCDRVKNRYGVGLSICRRISYESVNGLATMQQHVSYQTKSE